MWDAGGGEGVIDGVEESREKAVCDGSVGERKDLEVGVREQLEEPSQVRRG